MVETPSGKQARDENFPVGSWLLPAHLRPHIANYYAYARAIDDIADNPNLAPKDKFSRLDRFEKVLRGEEKPEKSLHKARAARDSMLAMGIDLQHGIDLVTAFKQDDIKLRYKTWDELIHYCLPIRPLTHFVTLFRLSTICKIARRIITRSTGSICR